MMRSRRYGRIVSIASVIGFSGNLGQTNYAASKAAIVGMTKSLALENASIGITVNAVAPGFIETQMTRALPEGIKEQLVRRIPAGRFGTPSEVATRCSISRRVEAIYHGNRAAHQRRALPVTTRWGPGLRCAISCPRRS